MVSYALRALVDNTAPISSRALTGVPKSAFDAPPFVSKSCEVHIDTLVRDFVTADLPDPVRPDAQRCRVDVPRRALGRSPGPRPPELDLVRSALRVVEPLLSSAEWEDLQSSVRRDLRAVADAPLTADVWISRLVDGVADALELSRVDLLEAMRRDCAWVIDAMPGANLEDLLDNFRRMQSALADIVPSYRPARVELIANDAGRLDLCIEAGPSEPEAQRLISNLAARFGLKAHPVG